MTKIHIVYDLTDAPPHELLLVSYVYELLCRSLEPNTLSSYPSFKYCEFARFFDEAFFRYLDRYYNLDFSQFFRAKLKPESFAAYDTYYARNFERDDFAFFYSEDISPNASDTVEADILLVAIGHDWQRALLKSDDVSKMIAKGLEDANTIVIPIRLFDDTSLVGLPDSLQDLQEIHPFVLQDASSWDDATDKLLAHIKDAKGQLSEENDEHPSLEFEPELQQIYDYVIPFMNAWLAKPTNDQLLLKGQDIHQAEKLLEAIQAQIVTIGSPQNEEYISIAKSLDVYIQMSRKARDRTSRNWFILIVSLLVLVLVIVSLTLYFVLNQSPATVNPLGITIDADTMTVFIICTTIIAGLFGILGYRFMLNRNQPVIPPQPTDEKKSDRLKNIKIFISYKRDPDQDVGECLHKLLESHCADAFLDEHDMSGGDFEETLKEEIRKRDYFLLILGQYTLESAYVRKEILHAYSLRKKIVPIWVRGYEGKMSDAEKSISDVDKEFVANSLHNTLPDDFTFLGKLESPTLDHKCPDDQIEKVIQRIRYFTPSNQ